MISLELSGAGIYWAHYIELLRRLFERIFKGFFVDFLMDFLENHLGETLEDF